jgi:two-component system, NtrC family, response regulator
MPSHILVIDDEKNYLLILETILQDAGFAVTTLNDPELAVAFLEESEVDVIITDMKMPKMSGQEILETARRLYPYIPVLIMTAYGSIDGAVEAMRCGAFDYIAKPFSNDELLLSVSKAEQLAKAEQRNRILRQSLEERYSRHQIIGRSRPMHQVLDMVDRVAPTRSTVLITGESGSGKELVAKAIHFASGRKDGPFISVNCMALNPGTLESELFGHEKGSFTGAVAKKKGRFELADGGTLFLDEIGELSHDVQVKLLRVLQERTFERVGGTQPVQGRPAPDRGDEQGSQVCRRGRLLPGGPLLPAQRRPDRHAPLRERREDIPLSGHALPAEVHRGEQEDGQRLHHRSDGLPHGLRVARQRPPAGERHRALRGPLRRRDGHGRGPAPDIRDEEAQFKSAVDLLPGRINLAETLEKIEAALIRRALARSGFVQVKAADLLGISKSLLQYKLKKYKISGW